MDRRSDATHDYQESPFEAQKGTASLGRAESLALADDISGHLVCDSGPHSNAVTEADHGLSDVSPDDYRTLVSKEAAEFIEGTVKAWALWAMELYARAHGLGLVVQATKIAWKAIQWVQVGEDNREFSLDAPIPLGYGVELDVSVPLTAEPIGGEPPVALCCVPSEGEPVGVVAIGGLTIGPGDRSDRPVDSVTPAAPQLGERQSDSPEPAGGHHAPSGKRCSPAVTVPADLPVIRPGEAGVDVTILRDLRDRLLQRRPLLEEAGVDFIVVYDPATMIAVWLRIDETCQPAWHLLIGPDATGRPTFHVHAHD